MRNPAFVDRGSGPPLVLIPGLQGRWEWMRPTVNALAKHFRVITFTLAGDWGSGWRFDRRLGFENYVAQVDDVLERAGIESPVLCGVSYGGLIAMRYAARRPGRVTHLVLASALPHDYVVDGRYRFYRRTPVLLIPVFLLESALRVSPEIRCAIPSLAARLRFSVVQGCRVMCAPAWPRHMRDRMELLASEDFREDVRRVQAPTLLITGEAGLDRTVRVELSRHYLEQIPGIEHVVLQGTGHMGTITRPEAFADAVYAFTRRSGAVQRRQAAS